MVSSDPNRFRSGEPEKQLINSALTIQVEVPWRMINRIRKIESAIIHQIHQSNNTRREMSNLSPSEPWKLVTDAVTGTARTLVSRDKYRLK